MKERLTERIYLAGTLGFENGFHLGTGEDSDVTDNRLARDVAGNIIIPGTSLCGALRDHLLKYYPSKSLVTETYFGTTEDKKISRVFIDDLYPEREGMRTTIRDGVAIRRDYGTARDRGKYDYEISERGAAMRFQMMVEFREADPHEEDMKQLLKTLIRDLKDGSVRVGGNKTRGVGSCKLEDIRAEQVRFPQDLKNFLKGEERGLWISVEDILKEPLLKPEIDILDITISCAVKDPLLIKDGMRSEADMFVEKTMGGKTDLRETDAYFVKVVTAEGKEFPVIPGASIKGIFRTRAEKILRTLGAEACDPTEHENVCKRRIDARLEALKSGDDPKTPKDEVRYAGIVEASCFACQIFGNTYLASRIFFEDSEVKKGVAKKFDGVAINRFTSGPVDAALFDMMPLVKGRFTLRVEAADMSDEETALLMFVLRDFKTGTIPLSIGFGKNKGYGIPLVSSVTVNGEDFEQFAEKKSGIFESWKNLWKKSQSSIS